MALAVAILGLVLLAGVVVVTTARRRDTAVATGVLSRETRRRDRSAAWGEGRPTAPATGRDVERAVATTRRDIEARPPTRPQPAAWMPPDEDTIGVSRRQFLNRGIVNLFGLGLTGFGAATLAFLWPAGSGGFGGKVDIPATLGEILGYYRANKQPYYYAPGRLYLSPYPAGAISKAEAVYEASVVAGMREGVVALYQKCPHLGCRVPWCATSQWFECPCHGSQYNRVGEKKGGPAPRGLDRFPIAISGQRLAVDTGIIVQGPPIGTNTTGQEAEGPHCVSAREE